MNTTAWVRTYVAPNGNITFNICKLEMKGSGLLESSYPQALIDTLQTTGDQPVSTNMQIGDSVTLPSFIMYSGRDNSGLDGPEHSVDNRPPPFPGGDGDGKPGVTIPTHVKADISVLGVYLGTFDEDLDVYAGLTIRAAMTDVKLSNATTMTGKASFSSHGYVFGATDQVLAAVMSTIEVTTNDPTVPITATKLDSDGSTTCAQIAAK